MVVQRRIGDLLAEAVTKVILLVLLHVRPQGGRVDVELPFHSQQSGQFLFIFLFF
jgi:hypothetical protein